MARREAEAEELTVWAGEDGTVSVDVGSRFVAMKSAPAPHGVSPP